jgi:hypothetical protein
MRGVGKANLPGIKWNYFRIAHYPPAISSTPQTSHNWNSRPEHIPASPSPRGNRVCRRAFGHIIVALMSLTAGTHLGPREVLSPLGAGHHSHFARKVCTATLAAPDRDTTA